MSAGAPWSVKGIEPKAREVAKDLARRSGMTLGEWLNQMIMEGEDEDGVTPLPRRAQAQPAFDRRGRVRRIDDAYHGGPRRFDADDLGGVLAAIDALSQRIEGAERNSQLAISGVDQAVAGLLRRVEAAERAVGDQSARVDDLSGDLRDAARRHRRFEEETGPRHMEAIRGLEGAVGKLAGQFYEAEARRRDESSELRQRMDLIERHGGGAAHEAVARATQRMEEAQGRTQESLRALQASFAEIDRRLRAAESQPGLSREAMQFEKLAETLTRRVEESRGEMLRRFDAASAEGRVDKIERALGDLAGHVSAAERRSAAAVEAMGKEVLRIAENLDRRLAAAEAAQDKGAAAVTQAVGADMARMADAIEQRLRRADDLHASALEKLGGEIGRISERLSERIAQGERRSAEAIEQLGDRFARMSEKIDERYDRAAGDLAERMRQSEERTARLLAEARETIERQQGARAQAAAPADWMEPGLAPFPTLNIQDAPPETDVFASEGLAEPQESPAPAEDPFAADLAEEPFAFAPDASASAPELATEPFAEPALEPFLGGFAQRPSDEPEPIVFAPQTSFDPISAPLAEAAPSARLSQPLDEPLDDGLDTFSAETEFVAQPPRSARDAVQAARAAMQSEDDKPSSGGGFGLRMGGKSRLQQRLEAQARRESATVKTALLASVTAVGLVSAYFGGPRAIEAVRGLLDGGDAAVQTPSGEMLLAASAVTPLPERAVPTEAATLFEQAQARLEEGAEDGLALLRQAANLGHPGAQLQLARLYEEGEAGLPVDRAEARLWTQRAAEGGEPRAMHNLALYLYDGVGGPVDQAAAASWFARAAQAGLADSQYNLGRLLEEGAAGVAPNLIDAYKWYTVAAASGDVEAEAGAERVGGRLSPAQRAAAESSAASLATEVTVQG